MAPSTTKSKQTNPEVPRPLTLDPLPNPSPFNRIIRNFTREKLQREERMGLVMVMLFPLLVPTPQLVNRAWMWMPLRTSMLKAEVSVKNLCFWLCIK
jgi:hypothetical protein